MLYGNEDQKWRSGVVLRTQSTQYNKHEISENFVFIFSTTLA
jgi:hypothetical protein